MYRGSGGVAKVRSQDAPIVTAAQSTLLANCLGISVPECEFGVIQEFREETRTTQNASSTAYGPEQDVDQECSWAPNSASAPPMTASRYPRGPLRQGLRGMVRRWRSGLPPKTVPQKLP